MLARRLRQLVAETGPPESLKRFWKEQVRSLVPGAFVRYGGSFKIAKGIQDALDALERLLEGQPEVVAEAAAEIVRRDGRFLECCDDSSGSVGDALKRALRVSGKASARTRRDPRSLAETILEQALADDYGIRDDIVAAFQEALGAEGLAHLRERLRFELRRAGSGALEPGTPEWSRRTTLGGLLGEVGDALGDVDLFIESCRASGRLDVHAVRIASRLLAAGRAAEALRTLDGQPPGRRRDHESRELRIAALDALGSGEEAQAARWDEVRESLDTEALDAYLARLPDDDARSAAEGEARQLARRHLHAGAGLGFLLERGASAEAAELVRTRLSDLDGDAYMTLRPAAGRLEEMAPDAAVLLFRLLVDAVLDARRSDAYAHAVRDLGAAERISRRVSWPRAGLASHEEYVATLKERHGRKYGFWSKVAAATSEPTVATKGRSKDSSDASGPT